MQLTDEERKRRTEGYWRNRMGITALPRGEAVLSVGPIEDLEEWFFFSFPAGDNAYRSWNPLETCDPDGWFYEKGIFDMDETIVSEGSTQDVFPSPERSMKVNIAPSYRALAQIYGIQLEPIDGVYSQMVLPAEAIIEKPLSQIRHWEDCVWYPIFLPGAREAGHFFGFLYDPFAPAEGHWLLMHFDHEITQ